MTTLRREARTKLEDVLSRFSDKLTLPERETIADLQVDALLELRGFYFLKTDEERPEYKLSPEELAKANKLVDAIIANSSGSHFEGREIFLPDHLPLVDWYHERTGQVCRKKDRNSWMKAVREWVDAGLTPDDLQAAYEVDIVWRKVISNPNELTSKAIALKAQKKAQPKEQEFYRTL